MMRKKTYLAPEMNIWNIKQCVILSGSNINIVSDDGNSVIDDIGIDDGGAIVIDDPEKIW